MNIHRSSMISIANTSTENEETYWDKVAKTRWGSYVTGIEKDMILKASKLAARLMDKTALDIGCGGGRWSLLLARQGWDITCTEIWSRELSVCQKRIPTAKCILVERDTPSLPCEAGSVGLLLCIEVFEVMRSNWFISEASRVLCPSGILVGIFANKMSPRGFLHNLSRTIRKLPVHYVIAYPRWKKHLLCSGFKLIEEEGLCWAPFARGSNSFLVPVFTNIEKLLGLRRLPDISPWIVLLARKCDTG